MFKQVLRFVVATIFISLSFSSQATLISGQIDEDDHLAIDTIGGFYYDLYEVTAGSTSDITFDLTSDGWGVWLGWGDIGLPDWPTGSDLPYDFISVGAGYGTDTSSGVFSPNFSGEVFQIIVTTQEYNPTQAGGYTLELDGEFSVQQITSVPEPSLTWLLAIMLMLVGRKYASRYH